MTDPNRMNLDQLGEEAEVSPRQIRELVRQAVLPPPSSRGRGATYGNDHLLRLRAWKLLRDEAPAGTTTEQIRVLIDRLEDAGLLRGIAEGSLPFALVDDQRNEVTIAAPDPGAGVSMDALPSPLPAFGVSESASYYMPPPAANEDALAYLAAVRTGATPPPARVKVAAASLRPMLEVDLGESDRSSA